MILGKAFLQERVIYEYMIYRHTYGQLKVKKIYENGKKLNKPTEQTVSALSIKNGYFPDIDNFMLKKDKFYAFERPAEVKFLTSEFKYHTDNNYTEKFQEFLMANGCIVVLRHDITPIGLVEKYKLDIFELFLDDFIIFTKENFDRLLHNQILGREGSHLNIWLMGQTRENFYGNPKKYKGKTIEPANKSNIWCPKNFMTPYEIDKKDIVIFVRFSGPPRTQQVVREYYDKYNKIHPEWVIKELWIGEVTENILSRKEYCEKNNLELSQPLWISETKTERKNYKLWPQVFEFKKDVVINKKIFLTDLYADLGEEIFKIFFNLFIQQNPTIISMNLYTNFLKWLNVYTPEHHIFQLEVKFNENYLEGNI
jgi:hypothetical protein